MRKIISLILVSVLASFSASAWGPRGHSSVASLAELNLRSSTKTKVEAYLGRSIVFYSSWMDEYREEAAYSYTNKSHVFPVGQDFRYSPVEGNLDAIELLNNAIAIVKDRRNQTDSTVAVNLKFIIHLVGDIHCPVHVKYTTINTRFNVIPYKGDKKMVSYHSIWDQQIIDRKCECMSPAELAADFNRLSKKEIQEIQQGTPEDWANENAAESVVIYDMAHDGDILYKPFYNPAWTIVQKQITRAGYRLAKVLNDCFR